MRVSALNRPTLVALIALAGCAGGSTPLAPDTGAVVEVSLWPVDPVEIEGQPSRTRPAIGAHVVVLDADDDVVAEGTTDENGMARVLLAPGSYTIRVLECPGAMSGPKEDGAVTVMAGAFATVALRCDTGIR